MNTALHELSKMSVVNVLMGAYYPARFLELSTAMTGHEFDRSRHELCARADLAKYRLDDGSRNFSADACAVDFGDPSASSDRVVRAVADHLGEGRLYDVVFCDPHHSYRDSLNDLRSAWMLLAPGGTLVVHDCNPLTEEQASPILLDAIWCGRTFEAFIDFVGESDLSFFTVDADYGIGVIRKNGPDDLAHPFDSLFSTMCLAGRAVWDESSPDLDRFPLFDWHRQDLLNLVTAGSFTAHCAETLVGAEEWEGGSTASPRQSLVRRPTRNGWTGHRSNAEVVGRYEEMADRWEVLQASRVRKVGRLENEIADQRVLLEERDRRLAAAASEAARLVNEKASVHAALGAKLVELSRCHAELAQARIEFADSLAHLRARQNATTVELDLLKSSSTFRLREVAVRARLPLLVWRTAAALVARLRPTRPDA